MCDVFTIVLRNKIWMHRVCCLHPPPPPPPTLSTFVNAIGLRYPRPWIKFFSVKTHFKNRLGVRGHFCGLFLPALDEPTRVCANCFMMHTLLWLVVRELHCVVHPCINRKVCPPEQQGSLGCIQGHFTPSMCPGYTST